MVLKGTVGTTNYEDFQRGIWPASCVVDNSTALEWGLTAEKFFCEDLPGSKNSSVGFGLMAKESRPSLRVVFSRLYFQVRLFHLLNEKYDTS